MKAKDFRTRAWNSLNGKWGILAVITLIISLIDGALCGLCYIGVGAIALLLVMGPLTLGVTIVSLKVLRGLSVEVGDAFLGFKDFGSAFLVALLNNIFIALWSLLFIIPGIVKSYSYSMSYYILADNPHLDANEARRRSIKMMDGNKWRLFCLDCSFIGWGILCILTFGILSFWILPYRQCAYAAFYEELLVEQNGNREDYSAEQPYDGANNDGANNEEDYSQPRQDDDYSQPVQDDYSQPVQDDYAQPRQDDDYSQPDEEDEVDYKPSGNNGKNSKF